MQIRIHFVQFWLVRAGQQVTVYWLGSMATREQETSLRCRHEQAGAGLGSPESSLWFFLWTERWQAPGADWAFESDFECQSVNHWHPESISTDKFLLRVHIKELSSRGPRHSLILENSTVYFFQIWLSGPSLFYSSETCIRHILEPLVCTALL